MGSDMIVALKEASANRTTLFGLNHHAGREQRFRVHVARGMTHDAGEVAHTSTLAVPQARQTYGVLGVQPLGGWGFTHGVNEHRVALGVTDWTSRRAHSASSMSGQDLARLALERGRSAHHAVEALTDLLEHLGGCEHGAGDHIFLIADATEAFVLETAGRYWAMLECGATRAVTDAAMIRQDWRRLAPGLADFAVENGWWNDDGTKLDFVGCLGQKCDPALRAAKRWGHFSLALAQQHGAIDLFFLRRMLAEQELLNRNLFAADQDTSPAYSFLVDLHTHEEPMIAWLAFGSPAVALYFPLCLIGELPAAFGESIPASPSLQDRVLELDALAQGKEKDLARVNAALERLQTSFDLDAEEFLVKAHDCTLRGNPHVMNQLATTMMQQHIAAFDREYRALLGIDAKPMHVAPVAEEVLFFA